MFFLFCIIKKNLRFCLLGFHFLFFSPNDLHIQNIVHTTMPINMGVSNSKTMQSTHEDVPIQHISRSPPPQALCTLLLNKLCNILVLVRQLANYDYQSTFDDLMKAICNLHNRLYHIYKVKFHPKTSTTCQISSKLGTLARNNKILHSIPSHMCWLPCALNMAKAIKKDTTQHLA